MSSLLLIAYNNHPLITFIALRIAIFKAQGNFEEKNFFIDKKNIKEIKEE